MSVLFLANFTRSKTFKSPWWSKGGTSDIITCPTVSERHWVMRWNIKQGIRKLFYFYPDPDIFPALFSTSRKILISYHRQERQVWSSKPQRTCKEGRSLQAMGKGLGQNEHPYISLWVHLPMGGGRTMLTKVKSAPISKSVWDHGRGWMSPLHDKEGVHVDPWFFFGGGEEPPPPPFHPEEF